MSNQKLLGVVLLIVGLIMLFFGWQASESVGEQLTEAVTGRFTDTTLWLLIGGVAALVAGFFLAVLRK